MRKSRAIAKKEERSRRKRFYRSIVTQRLRYRSCRNDIAKLGLYYAYKKSSNAMRIVCVCVCVLTRNNKVQKIMIGHLADLCRRDGNDHAKIDGIEGWRERKNHCKSRGSMTVVDPLLYRKLTSPPTFPFEHEFKVGSMSLHDGDGQAPYAHA